MALVFAWRSDDANIRARYSTNGKQGVLISIGGPTRGSDAGAIGSFSIDMTNTGAPRSLQFEGKNFANGRAFSVLFREKVNYTGAPAATRGKLMISNGRNSTANHMLATSHAITSGNINIFLANDSAATINGTSIGAWSPTSGTWYDHVITYDGTSSANSFKYYIDAALHGQLTPSAAWDSTITNDYFHVISFGANSSGGTPASYLNEIVIWDSVIDPTANVNLESGAGLLNGASRTSYVSDVAGATLTSFDGLNSTDPGASKVLTSAGTYYINGVLKTPTYDDTNLINSNVKSGVSYGVTGLGTYSGSGGGGGYGSLRRR